MLKNLIHLNNISISKNFRSAKLYAKTGKPDIIRIEPKDCLKTTMTSSGQNSEEFDHYIIVKRPDVSVY